MLKLTCKEINQALTQPEEIKTVLQISITLNYLPGILYHRSIRTRASKERLQSFSDLKTDTCISGFLSTMLPQNGQHPWMLCCSADLGRLSLVSASLGANRTTES